MRNVIAATAMVLALTASAVMADPKGDTKIYPNLCGYSCAHELMDTIREKWWTMDLAELLPEESLLLMKEFEKIEPRIKALKQGDEITRIEVPEFYEHILLTHKALKQITGENAKKAEKLLAHVEKMKVKIKLDPPPPPAKG